MVSQIGLPFFEVQEKHLKGGTRRYFYIIIAKDQFKKLEFSLWRYYESYH